MKLISEHIPTEIMQNLRVQYRDQLIKNLLETTIGIAASLINVIASDDKKKNSALVYVNIVSQTLINAGENGVNTLIEKKRSSKKNVLPKRVSIPVFEVTNIDTLTTRDTLKRYVEYYNGNLPHEIHSLISVCITNLLNIYQIVYGDKPESEVIISWYQLLIPLYNASINDDMQSDISTADE